MIDTVLVKLASRCNLERDYCYVYQMGNEAWRLQPKLMKVETLAALARNLATLVEAQGSPLSIVFHGGEPLLVGADRFEQQWSVHDDIVALTQSLPFLDYHRSQRPLAAACLGCPELRICGGGMPTHRWSTERGLDNPSIFCADQKHLIDAMRRRTEKLVAA
jgi:sulfatase maturation enzyme AslB (radical SAM superfamily)